MVVTILQNRLEKGANAATKIISQKAQLPILANILLTAQKGELLLSATNLHESVVCRIPAKVETLGQITIPGKLFTEFIHLLPAKPVRLSLDQQTVHVSCENAEADFNGIAATEFPKLPQFTLPVLFTIPQATLRDLVSEVTFASSKDESRPILTGVQLVLANKTITMVATDGFRLSYSARSIGEGISEQTLLIPAKMLEELVRLSSEFEGDNDLQVSLLPDQNQLVVRLGSVDVSLRLLEGTFPDYQRVIPKDLETEITVDREDFLKAVRLASVFSRDGLSVVKVTIESQGLILSSDAKEIGNDTIKVGAEVAGEGGEIAFNPRFLLEVLQTIPTDQVTFQMTGPLNPAVFHKTPVDEFLHVIMPVRT